MSFGRFTQALFGEEVFEMKNPQVPSTVQPKCRAVADELGMRVERETQDRDDVRAVHSDGLVIARVPAGIDGLSSYVPA